MLEALQVGEWVCLGLWQAPLRGQPRMQIKAVRLLKEKEQARVAAA